MLRRTMQAVLIVFFALPLNLWSTESHPKLIVIVVVDQMRADYLQRFSAYETGGLHYFATQGANFVNANYQHWPTETCVGHTVLLSGRTPAHTGIVANAWYDRTAGKSNYCLADTASPLVGDNGPAVSPRNILGDNFSDWLRNTYPKSQIYSISLKDRGAITLAGASSKRCVLVFIFGAIYYEPLLRRTIAGMGGTVQPKKSRRPVCGKAMGSAPRQGFACIPHPCGGRALPARDAEKNPARNSTSQCLGLLLATKFSKRLRKLRLLRIVWGRSLATPALTCLP